MSLIFFLALVINIAGLVAAKNAHAEGDKNNTSQEVQYLIKNNKLFQISNDAETELPLPAAATAMYRHGNELYVALGAYGVVILQLSSTALPSQTKHVEATGGRVVGFFEVDDQVCGMGDVPSKNKLMGRTASVVAAPRANNSVVASQTRIRRSNPLSATPRSCPRKKSAS